MAEKETASDAGQQHKPQTILQLPEGLTSKPTKQQQQQQQSGGKPDNSQGSGGYYFNVAQKGKLILPTALWILLIIAGIAFLTLLASLSRTLDTLDTLVELEQEKVASARLSDHLRHQHGWKEAAPVVESASEHKEQHQGAADRKLKSKAQKQQQQQDGEQKATAGKDQPERSHDDLEFSDSLLGPLASSWLSLPSWASLERPMQAAQGPRRRHPSDMDQVGPMMAPFALGPQMPDEISGTIVISTPEGMTGPDAEPSGMIRSLMRQVMPMIESFMGSQQAPAAGLFSQQAAKAVEDADEEDDEPVTLTAKINNLNINLGPASNAEEAKRPMGGTNKKATRETEIKSLEKSIDELVSRLMEQKSAQAEGPQPLEALVRPPPPFGMFGPSRLEELAVPPSPLRAHSHGHSLSMRPPLSPLASLLMRHPPPEMDAPGDDSMQAMIIGPLSGPAELDSLLAAAGARPMLPGLMPPPPPPPRGHRRPGPDMDQVIVSFGQPEDRPRANLKNTRRPVAGGPAPYELAPAMPPSFVSLLDALAGGPPPTSEQVPVRDHSSVPPAVPRPAAKQEKSASDAKWDMFSNDLADAIIQSASASAQPVPSPDKVTESTVLVVNGKPVPEGEREKLLNSLFGSLPGETKGSPIGDMMSLMLEPLRPQGASAKLATSVRPQSQEKTAAPEPSVAPAFVPSLATIVVENEPSPAIGKLNVTPSELPASPSSAPAAPVASSAAPIVQSASSPADSDSSADPDDASTRTVGPDPTEMMNDLINTVFTLPQFGGNQRQPASTGADSSSSPSSGSSSSAVETTTPAASSATTATTTATTTTKTVETSTSSSLAPISASESVPELSRIFEALAGASGTTKGEIVKDPLLRNFLGVDDAATTIKELSWTPTSAPVTTTSTTPMATSTQQSTTTSGTTPGPQEATTAKVSTPSAAQVAPDVAGLPSGARVIREEDAPLSVPIIDLGPFKSDATPDTSSTPASPATTKGPLVSPVASSILTATSAQNIPTSQTLDSKNTSTTTEAIQHGASATTEKPAGGAAKLTPTTHGPLKSFLKKADDFFERNLLNFKKLF